VGCRRQQLPRRGAERFDGAAATGPDWTGLAPPRYQRVNILPSARPHARASVARPPPALFTQVPAAVPNLPPSPQRWTIADARLQIPFVCRAGRQPHRHHRGLVPCHERAPRAVHGQRGTLSRGRPAGRLTRAPCGRDSGPTGRSAVSVLLLPTDRPTCRRRRNDCRLCAAYVTRV